MTSMTLRIFSVGAALLTVFTASSAMAQDAAGLDWTLHRDERTGLTVAYSAFDNGLAIGARCSDGIYQVVISGLPNTQADTRTLRIGFHQEPLENQTWYVTRDQGTAISGFPAPFARRLRNGGRMDIVVPGGGEGGRNLRYIITLPGSSRAIDESLAACARPLDDPRDAQIASIGQGGLPDGAEWAIRPKPQYPETMTANGFATLTCLNQADGSLRDCVIEAEYPQQQGIGRAALRAVTRARLQNKANPASPMASGMISFTTNFCLDGYCPGQRRELPTGSRLPVTSPDG